MRVKIYTEFGALNSKPVFDAVRHGLLATGHSVVNDNEELAVIWSVLWQGRMQRNQQVYANAKSKNIPVMIIEVGNLKRGDTWRISLNNINGLGQFANNLLLDENRPAKLKVSLAPLQLKRQSSILIATQHEKSLQWTGMKPMVEWVKETITQIRKYSDRKIIVRPHPRCNIQLSLPGIEIQQPRKIPNSYDQFDINYNFHCVVNHNSGPAVHAAVAGCPVICDTSSLAHPVSDTIEHIENPALLDRTDWFLKLCHTEWTLPEITAGAPFERLIT
jgi:hypothetical protein